MCYCFAISTVFQAFFVSYLVEPGNGEKISTFQELLDSNVNYGFVSTAEVVIRTAEYSDHLQFPLTRRVDCVNLKTCLMRKMSNGDVATVSSAMYSNLIFNELGYQGGMDPPCSLDDDFVYLNMVAMFTRV
jgi:hypothetical protein